MKVTLQKIADTDLGNAKYGYQLSDNSAKLAISLHRCRPKSLSPADEKRLWQWMNYPHVAKFWHQAWSKEKIKQYLLKQINSHHAVYFIAIENMPIAYAELYPIKDDVLSTCCEHQYNDWGWHFLIGPQVLIGKGIAHVIGHAILRFLFTQTTAAHIFCEPDVYNQRMINLVKRLAHHSQGVIQLADKKAALMVCNKTDFINLATPQLPLNIPFVIDALQQQSKEELCR